MSEDKDATTGTATTDTFTSVIVVLLETSLVRRGDAAGAGVMDGGKGICGEGNLTINSSGQ